MPTLQNTLLHQGSAQSPRGKEIDQITVVTKQQGSNRVNQRQALATLPLSLITQTPLGLCSIRNHIAQQAGPKWLECDQVKRSAWFFHIYDFVFITNKVRMLPFVKGFESTV